MDFETYCAWQLLDPANKVTKKEGYAAAFSRSEGAAKFNKEVYEKLQDHYQECYQRTPEIKAKAIANVK